MTDPRERNQQRIADLAQTLGKADLEDIDTVRAIARACERLENALLAPILQTQATECLELIPDLLDHEERFLSQIAAGLLGDLSDRQSGWLGMLAKRLTPEGAEAHRQWLATNPVRKPNTYDDDEDED